MRTFTSKQKNSGKNYLHPKQKKGSGKNFFRSTNILMRKNLQEKVLRKNKKWEKTFASKTKNNWEKKLVKVFA